MNVLVKEITSLIDSHCNECPVSSAIRKLHGDHKKKKYCKELCPYGLKISKLSKEVEFGYDTAVALKLDYDTYIVHKEQGMTDKEICKKYKIGNSTLYTRKRAWKIPKIKEPVNKKFDKLDKKEYYALKLQNFSDKEIAKMWGIGNGTLVRFKKENNIQGGLDPTRKLDKMNVTKEQYLKYRLEGHTDYQIARLLGISKNTIYEWKKTKGLRG